MKNKILGTFLTIVLVLANSNELIYAKETPDELKNLYAQSAVLIDADSGRILFGKNENDVLPMASTTKIMTCILALEYMDEGQTGTVSEYASKQPKVHLGIRKGEVYYIEDLLYSLMLESHNDSAVVIAETIGGTVEEFANMMNNKAKELGCTDTYFITPNGLDEHDVTGKHSTTASDLAHIMSYCIQNSPKKEEFLKISQTNTYQFSDLEETRIFTCHNHNAFLGMMDKAIAGKTGYTNAAGYCYVGAVQDKDRTFVVALLACGWPNNKGYKWQDTKKLMNYALSNYKYQKLSKEMNTDDVFVKRGVNHSNYLDKNIYVKTCVVHGSNNLKYLLHNDEKIDIKIVQKQYLKAPVRKGQVVGKVYYILGKTVISSKDIITVDPVDEIDIKVTFAWLMKMFCM